MAGTVEATSSMIIERTRRWTESSAFRWLYPIAIFLVARLVNVVMFVVASRDQIAVDTSTFDGMFVHTAKPAAPDYWSVVTNWDGQWYESVAVDGYRTPSADEGSSGLGGADAPIAWAWAFPPLFPLMVRAVMIVAQAPFAVAATVLNLVAGAVGMLLLYRLLERTGGRFLATSGVALTSCFISAPLFQMAYSESLAFALLMAIFLQLQSQRYIWTALLVIALAFTRLITPPLAIVALGLVLVRWRARNDDARAYRDVIGLSAVALVAVGGLWFWSGLASLVAPTATGASARTQLPSGIFLGWFSDSYAYLGVGGPALIAVFLALLVAISRQGWTHDWGLELRTWLWAYPLFIMAATPITGGIIRYLLMCPPIALLAAGSRDTAPRLVRTSLVAMGCCIGLLLQLWWIHTSLIITSDYLMP